MRCNECNREVHFAEFMGYTGAFLLKTVGPLLITAAINRLSEHLSSPAATTQTRGVVDNTMAGFALLFKIECPDCGKCRWQAASSPKAKTPKKIATQNRNSKDSSISA